MNKLGGRHLPPQPNGGVSLIEALVALAILSLGILALVGAQATLRYNTDLSRQRAEAARIAAQELEKARYFARLDTTSTQSVPAWDELGSGTVEGYALPGDTQNTSFNITRTVTTLQGGGAPRKLVQVVVDWTDRTSTSRDDPTRQVRMSTLVVAADPQLSGALLVRHDTPATSRRAGRNASIPSSAKDLGDGSSGYKPFDSGTSVWVFNNNTGVVTRLCSSVSTSQSALTTADLSNCQDVSGRVVTGTVWFDLTAAPNAQSPAGPEAHPLDGSTPLAFTSGSAVNTSASSLYCTSNSVLDATLWAALSPKPKYVQYACLVVLTDSSVGWGGSLSLTPGTFTGASAADWAVGATSSTYKVCRYTTYKSDTSTADYVPNAQHPKTYCKVSSATCSARVTENLGEQNFLVIAGDQSCPSDTRSIDPAGGVLVTYHTRQHQP